MRIWLVLCLSIVVTFSCNKGKEKSGTDQASESNPSTTATEAEAPLGVEVAARKRTKRSGGKVPQWFKTLSGGIISMKAFKNMDGLRKDLGAMSTRKFGFNVLDAKHLAVFGMAASDIPLVAITGNWSSFRPKGESMLMDGRSAYQLEGELWVIKDGNVLWLSNANGLTMMTAVADGKKPSLAASDTMGDLAFSVSKAIGNAPTLFVYLGAAEPLDELLREVGAPRGISLDSLAAGTNKAGDVGLGVFGDALSADQLHNMLKVARTQAQVMLKELYDENRLSDNMERAFEAITSYHYGKAALQSVETKKVNGGVVVRVKLGVPEVGLLGGLSVVAIPAFVKYMRRAKTTEAIDQLDKIYKSSSHYYAAPRVAAGTGLKIECQFPASQVMTPDVTGKKCCGGANDIDGDDRCDVNTAQWTTETWSALNFQMNDQHYFGYTYESSGTLAAAQFTVTANADLDCDGILSTFQRFGYGDESASHAECSMKGSSAFYIDNETE